MAAVANLGELRLSKLDSQDITDQYYDLQAHIKNDQVREEGLQKLYLKKAETSKLDDLLAVDRELSSVRGHIEVQQGQLKRWDKETEFATAVVTLRDRKDYIPPTVPDFGTSIGRTFQGSVELLIGLGKSLVLAVVALGPWLIVFGGLGIPGWRVFRRYRTSRPAPAKPTQTTDGAGS
jgi:hypothetical protein